MGSTVYLYVCEPLAVETEVERTSVYLLLHEIFSVNSAKLEPSAQGSAVCCKSAGASCSSAPCQIQSNWTKPTELHGQREGLQTSSDKCHQVHNEGVQPISFPLPREGERGQWWSWKGGSIYQYYRSNDSLDKIAGTRTSDAVFSLI